VIDPTSRPLLVVVTSNLMDRGPFESAATIAGYRCAFVRANELSDLDPLAAFVDLEAEDSDKVITNLSGRGVRVIAYGPHLDDMSMVRARSLGADSAEPRSRMLRHPAAYLPPLV